MSTLGPLTFGKKEEQIFLGREIAQHRDYSEATAIRIDEEVQRLVTEGYGTAKDILDTNREALERIALALIEREVIDGAEVQLLIEGKELPIKVVPPKSDDGGVQHVLRPEPGRTPAKGGERPATA
jgi:cell division protease FtsH